MKRYRKKAKLAMTAALMVSSLSSSMNYVFAQQENKVQENASTEESSIEKEEVVEEKEELQNKEKATGDVEVNEDNFPDAIFRKYISDNFDSNQDGVLSSDELNAVTAIYLSGTSSSNDIRKITSVIGVEYFPNLRELYIHKTQLTSIDISKNVALKLLYIVENQLTNIDVSKNVVLENFSISKNQIKNIDVSKNEALKYLNIDENQLTSIDISKNVILENLNISENQIENIDVSKNIALKYLNIEKNQLTSIDISKNVILENLNISRNQIKNIDVSKNVALKYLNIDLTKIEGIDITNNPNMTTFYNQYHDTAWLNIGDNPNLTLVYEPDNLFNLGVLHDDTFNIQERFPGIDLNKIMSIEGAQIDKTTGIISGYEAGRRIRYTYDCGVAGGDKKILNVILEFRISSTISINDNLDKEYDGNKVNEPSTTKIGSTGEVTFEWFKQSEDGQWVSLEEAPTNAGNYGVKAYLASDEYYAAADSGEPTPFTISQAQSNIAINSYDNKVWDGNPISNPMDIIRTENEAEVSFKYYRADDMTEITAPSEVGEYKVKAFLSGDANYIDSESDFYDFSITAVGTTITFTYENQVYTGSPVRDPKYTVEGSTGEVTIEWYEANDLTRPLEQAPVNVGSYVVKVSVAGTSTHDGASATAAFQITKADSNIVIQDDLSKVYDGHPVTAPTNVETTGSSGDVRFEWYAEDGTKLAEAPVNVGNYKVKAILAEDSNYHGAEVEKAFTIFQTAVDQITVEIINDITREYVEGKVIENPEVRVTLNGSEFTNGAITFEWYKQGEMSPLVSAPMNAGSYEVVAKLEGTTNYASAQSARKEFTIHKATSTLEISYASNSFEYGSEVPNPIVATNRNEAEVKFRWYRADAPDTVLVEKPTQVGDYLVEAYVEENENYLAQTTNKLSFTIRAGLSTIIIHDDLNKVYDGQPVSEPAITQTGSQSTPIYEWYVKGNGNAGTYTWIKLAEAPVEVGSYKLVVSVAEDKNYYGATAEAEFSISKSTNAWTTELSMQGWVYGEEANTPQAEVQFGKITYTYSTSEDGVYTEEVPSDAGIYWIKASVEGTDNYEGLEAKVSFTIEKANSSITIDTDLNKVYDGQPVSEPAITQTGSQSTPVYEWYVKDKGTARTDTWTKLAEAPVGVGSYKLVVSVAEDTNYHGATAEVEFSIKVETVVVPTPPNGGTITNPDGGEIVVKPGDDIESNGPVIENPDGSITFPEGGTVTKPDGSVEVIQPGGVLTPNNPNDEVIETPGETIDGVQTGDVTQTSIWAMLVGLSMSMMYFFRRKKNK